jgi:hypothetical protein
MRPALPCLALVTAVALTGCGGGSPDAAPDGDATPSAAGYSADVRENFLTSCIDNATNTAGGAASEEQLTQTCECILGKVEQEYSEAEFAEFEQRLLGGEASEQENSQLVGWSTSCAEEAAS